ncbi:MAG: helix-turn-helix domain-containing protein [Thermodesulfobacteriota bacterium]
MLEPTRKPPTEAVSEARFVGPAEKIRELARVARGLGLTEVSGTIPWRELFPGFQGAKDWAVALRGARGKEGLTQKALAALTGIPQSHISSMENGRMPIGRQRAMRLAEALKIDYRVLL